MPGAFHAQRPRRVPNASSEMVSAAIRIIFAPPDADHVRSQMNEVARMLAARFPDVTTMLTDTAEDRLAFTAFPEVLWARSGSRIPSNV